MLIFAIAVLVLVPIVCVALLADKAVDPSIQFVAMLMLAPFVYILVRVLRLNL